MDLAWFPTCFLSFPINPTWDFNLFLKVSYWFSVVPFCFLWFLVEFHIPYWFPLVSCRIHMVSNWFPKLPLLISYAFLLVSYGFRGISHGFLLISLRCPIHLFMFLVGFTLPPNHYVWFPSDFVWFSIDVLWLSIDRCWFSDDFQWFPIGFLWFPIDFTRCSIDPLWFPIHFAWSPIGFQWFLIGCLWLDTDFLWFPLVNGLLVMSGGLLFVCCGFHWCHMVFDSCDVGAFGVPMFPCWSHMFLIDLQSLISDFLWSPIYCVRCPIDFLCVSYCFP